MQISGWGNIPFHPENKAYADCVVAEEAFAKSCCQPGFAGVYFGDQEVVDWAQRHGFLPNEPTMPAVMDAMRTDGFPHLGITYYDGARSELTLATRGTVPLLYDPVTMKCAIMQGPVKTGVAYEPLRAAYDGRNCKDGWFGTGLEVTDAEAETHCVSVFGYGALGWLATWFRTDVPPDMNPQDLGYAVFTWGSIGFLDEESFRNIAEEAWLRRPTTTTSKPTPESVANPLERRSPSPVPSLA